MKKKINTEFNEFYTKSTERLQELLSIAIGGRDIKDFEIRVPCPLPHPAMITYQMLYDKLFGVVIARWWYQIIDTKVSFHYERGRWPG